MADAAEPVMARAQARLYSASMSADAPQPESDEALMQAFAAGDAAAFDMLYARHRRGLYGYLARLLPTEAGAADDLFQETWLRVARGRAAYRPRAAFRTWLFTIARHLAIDHLRRHRPVLASELLGVDAEAGDCDVDPLERIADDPSTQPDAQASARQQAQRLRDALAALPAVQREAILLREHGEHSLDEIARITGVNVETAKSRLRYAIGKLRGMLAPMKEPAP